MENNTVSKVERNIKIQAASQMIADEILYQYLSKIIEFRNEAAKKIMGTVSDEEAKLFLEAYDYYNSCIMRLLAI